MTRINKFFLAIALILGLVAALLPATAEAGQNPFNTSEHLMYVNATDYRGVAEQVILMRTGTETTRSWRKVHIEGIIRPCSENSETSHMLGYKSKWRRYVGQHVRDELNNLGRPDLALEIDDNEIDLQVKRNMGCSRTEGIQLRVQPGQLGDADPQLVPWRQYRNGLTTVPVVATTTRSYISPSAPAVEESFDRQACLEYAVAKDELDAGLENSIPRRLRTMEHDPACQTLLAE